MERSARSSFRQEPLPTTLNSSTLRDLLRSRFSYILDEIGKKQQKREGAEKVCSCSKEEDYKGQGHRGAPFNKLRVFDPSIFLKAGGRTSEKERQTNR
jgi:hypothetical protein